MSSVSASRAPRRQGAGLVFVISAYALWGAFPLYFLLLAPATPFEVVAFRVVLSLVFCVLVITVLRRWRAIVGLLRQPRVVATMAFAGALIYVNWLFYVLAVFEDRVVEAALGYFINPIGTVLLGVIVLR